MTVGKGFINNLNLIMLFKIILVVNGDRTKNSLKYPFFPNNSVVVSTDEAIHESYLYQPRDHFDPLNNHYWSQKYIWNGDFYYRGGPIFILLGGKSALNNIWLEKGAIMEMCKYFRGVAFIVEHRFFGESWPIKNTETENLRYLTTEQILADFAEFIKYIKYEYYLDKNKIIVVGIASELPVYMREEYPHLVDIAWSSAAAINKTYNFYKYFKLIGQVINEISTSCYSTVKAGFDDLEKLLWLGCNKTITKRHRGDYKSSLNYGVPPIETCQLIEDTFNLCEPLDLNNEDDIRNFFQYLAQSFAYIIQYNSNMGNYSMEKICSNIINNSSTIVTPIKKLSMFIELFNSLLGFKCSDFTQKKFCEELSKTGVDETVTDGHWVFPRQSFWLICSQIGSLQSSDSQYQPFGRSFPASFLAQQCKCVFGKRFTEKFITNQIQTHTTKYGGNARTKFHSRIIFANGEYDPWSPLGVIFDNQTSCENKVIYIKGASQGCDMGPTSPTDSPEVTAARHAILTQLEKWLTED